MTAPRTVSQKRIIDLAEFAPKTDWYISTDTATVGGTYRTWQALSDYDATGPGGGIPAPSFTQIDGGDSSKLIVLQDGIYSFDWRMKVNYDFTGASPGDVTSFVFDVYVSFNDDSVGPGWYMDPFVTLLGVPASVLSYSGMGTVPPLAVAATDNFRLYWQAYSSIGSGNGPIGTSPGDALIAITKWTL